MPDQNQAGSANVQAGSSPDDLIKTGPAGGDLEPKGQPANLDDFVPKAQYKELETKLGQQGKELGDLRKYESFFAEVSPLLEKLQDQPELVQAIMDGNIDSNLAQAAIDGKIKIEDAKIVTEAHEGVKEKLGAEAYAKASPQDIEKLVEAAIEKKLKETEKNLKAGISEIEEKREFENRVNEFIKNTPDFPEVADEVAKWFAEHPDQYDIEVAYSAVKGMIEINRAREEAQVKAAEAAKAMAANAGAGGSQGGSITEQKNLADQLIGGRINPNTF